MTDIAGDGKQVAEEDERTMAESALSKRGEYWALAICFAIGLAVATASYVLESKELVLTERVRVHHR